MATVIVEEEVTKGQRDVDSVDIGQLRVVGGCCCGLGSLYCNGKKSCGCQSKGTVICCNGEFDACVPSAEEKLWCTLFNGDCNCGPPSTCVMLSSRLFCLDQRCAFPCNDEVPCIVNALGLTCCYAKKCKPSCCKTLSEIDPEYSHTKEIDLSANQMAVTYGAPEDVEATR